MITRATDKLRLLVECETRAADLQANEQLLVGQLLACNSELDLCVSVNDHGDFKLD